MNKKTKIIIGIIAFLLIVVICVGGYFLFKDTDKTDDTNWLDCYMEQLLEDFKDNELYTDIENVSIQFVDVPDYDLPMMIVSYEKNNMTQMLHYSITRNRNGYTSWIMSKGNIPNFDYELTLLYDIKKQEYVWFEHRAGKDALGENEWYSSIKHDGGESHRFLQDELTENQTEEDGTPILSKYEEKFIKIDKDPESIKIENIHNLDKGNLKKSINLANTKCEKIEDIITDEIKKETQNKLTELENKKEQIKVANEEKAKKKAEEDATKKAQEEAAKKAEENAKKQAEEAAKNGFTVGSYTMMYGTYIGSGGFDNFNEGATLVLNSNGTYTLTRSGRTSNGTFTYSGSGYIDFDGGSWSYRALNNNVFGGTGYDEAFTYAGY